MKVLTKLTNTVAETIVEAVQKKPGTAFMNNIWAGIEVTWSHKQLAKDFLLVEQDPNLLDELEKSVLNHPKVKELGEEKAGKVFVIVWGMIVFSSKGVLKIKEIVEE